MIAFAKLVLLVATAIPTGNDLPWPILHRSDGPAVWMIDAPVVGEGSTAVQVLCLQNAGMYLITARIGFRPLPRGAPDVNGQLWLKGAPGAGEIQLAPLYATAGKWTAEGATHQFVAQRAGCYSLRYDLDGVATVNEDPRVTYLAVKYEGATLDPFPG